MIKKKKRLRAQITVGHDATGAPIYKWASGYTKKELSENKEELRRTYINGAIAVRRDIQLGEFVKEWYEIYKLGAASHGGRKISASTQANYRTAINVHIFPAFADRQMRAITAGDLQRFMNGLNSYSRTLIGDVYGVLKNVFSMAYAQGIVDRDPAVALKKPEAGSPTPRRALTPAETSAVLKLIDTHPDGLLLAILYYSGVRRGEALGLQWNDINFAKRQLSIRRDIDFDSGTVGEVKSKCSLRDIPIVDELYCLLQKNRSVGAGFVIQSPHLKSYWSQGTFVRHWNAIQKAIYDIDHTVENAGHASILTPHYFRHNYATLLFEADVDVLTAQVFLGHADPKTTLKIYTHLRETKRVQNTEKLQKAFSRPI
jgi:integrase